jgi:hypothetical protein
LHAFELRYEENQAADSIGSELEWVSLNITASGRRGALAYFVMACRRLQLGCALTWMPCLEKSSLNLRIAQDSIEQEGNRAAPIATARRRVGLLLDFKNNINFWRRT